MKKKAIWVKGLAVSLLAAALMIGAAAVFTAGESKIPMAGGLVEATNYDKSSRVEEIVGIEEKAAPAEEKAAETPDQSATLTAVEAPSAAPLDQVAAVSAAGAEKAPVSYSYGAQKGYTLRMEVSVTNTGSEDSRNVSVSVPFLENSSPYQQTALKSVNYEVVSTSGRVSTIDIGDLAPGESKTVVADFEIKVRTVSLNSSDETVELARQAFEEHKGSGNCRELALAFIAACERKGVRAREVIGYARPQRGEMTSGSLAGSRHSWAEFYVEGLGWVPVDLTFQYFGAFPETSHIVESYADQSLRVNFTGGSLSAAWSNTIL